MEQEQHGLSGDAIAIVGLSCQFPGANDEHEFWDLLMEGRDETKPLPQDRLFTKSNLQDNKDPPIGYIKCPIDSFDAKFFEISPRAAQLMDPQQRLLLEVSWEALENAGINPQCLRGTNTAVFVGMWSQEYAELMKHTAKTSGAEFVVGDFQHKYLGNSLCGSSAHISHFFGLHGPSIVTESGCASALEAVHHATEALKSRKTDLVLACGVNLALGGAGGGFGDKDAFVLSKEGKCKTFDESADGFARAEACVCLVLKRMSDAVRDCDEVLGLIRGSALNHNGAGAPLGTPNPEAVASVIRSALETANIGPNHVSYVEAHGTGTPVGDPLEFQALNQVFGGTSTGRTAALYVGSVKTNIGHTEAASGMAGLVKVLMAMRHRTIPRHLHLKNLNSNIALEVIPAIIPLVNTEWKPTNTQGLIAGVSSFGLSGTNVHVILQEPPPLPNRRNMTAATDMERTKHLFVLSAKSDLALQQLVSKYIELLESSRRADIGLADLAYSANTGRAHFRNRLAVVAKDSKELLTKLKKGNYISQKAVKKVAKMGFLFNGQGSQYVAMAKTLYHTHPVFKLNFNKCARLCGLDLANTLSYKDATLHKSGDLQLNDSIISQPAIFCIEVCLAKLWASWGITPDFVLGHSVGEFAAAVVAGVLSLEEGMRLVVGRSKLVNTIREGAMLVVGAPLDAVERIIKEFGGDKKSLALQHWVDIAAHNSSSEVVVSGSVDSIDGFEAFVDNNMQGVGTKRLAASHAFHSRDMDQIQNQYREIVQTIQMKGKELRCGYMSGTMGHKMELADFNSEYWLRHLRDTVQFATAFRCLAEEDVGVFVEVGPQPILLGLGMGSTSPVAAAQCCWCPSMRKSEGNWVTILTSLAKMYALGVKVDWAGYDAPFLRARLPLPNYPWEHEKFWFKAPSSICDSMIINSKLAHPILGARVPMPPLDSVLYYNSLSLASLPYIADHKVAGNVIMPAAAYLELVLAAGRDLLCGGASNVQIPLTVTNLVVESALSLEEDQNTQIQAILKATTSTLDDGQLEYYVSVWEQSVYNPSGSDGGKWKRIVTAKFVPCAIVNASSSHNTIETETLQSNLIPCTANQVELMYETLAQGGITFGPSFKSMRRIWHSDSELLVEVLLPEAAEGYTCHPIVLDAMIQCQIAVEALAGQGPPDGMSLPTMVNRCTVTNGSRQTPTLYIHTFRHDGSDESNSARLYNEHGSLLACLQGVQFIRTTVPAFLRQLTVADDQHLPDFFQEVWHAATGPHEGRVGVSADHSRLDGCELAALTLFGDSSPLLDAELVCKAHGKSDALSLISVSSEAWLQLLTGNGFVNPQEYGKLEGLQFKTFVAFAGPCLAVPSPPLAAETADQSPNTWLVFGQEGDPVCQHLIRQFHRVGREVVLVIRQHTDTCHEIFTSEFGVAAVYAVNPLTPAHLTQLYLDIQSKPHLLEGIMYLWGIDTAHQSHQNGEINYEFQLKQTNGGLLHLIQALKLLRSKPKLVVVTKGSQYVHEDQEPPTNPVSATLAGILLSFLNECNDYTGVFIDMDAGDGTEGVEDLFHQIWLNDGENQVAFRRAGKKYVRRLVSCSPSEPPLVYPNAERFKLDKPPQGTISDLNIVIGVKEVVGIGHVEVKVSCSALNFKDVFVANSHHEFIPAQFNSSTSKFARELGVDFAGIVTSVNGTNSGGKFDVGDRVYGSKLGGALASHVVVHESCLHSMNEAMSFEEASTLPCVFLTAIYFLIHQGKLNPSDRLLIHVASGGVGLAAIQVAKAIGAEIYATAGSRRKRQYLQSLGIQHIYNSRDTRFAKEILDHTNGAGVTVALNSLTGPGFKEATLEALGHGGRFLEMAKVNVWSSAEVQQLRPDVVYFIQGEVYNESVPMAGAFGDLDEYMQTSQRLAAGLASGAYHPLPYTLFPMSSVKDAFRFLQEAKHIGKVVVRVPATTACVDGRMEHHEELFNPHSTYLITGGLGGLGLEVAKWVVGSGAKYLFLVCRKPPTARAELILSGLRSNGAVIIVQSADVADFDAIRSVIGRIDDPTNGFPPLRGVMHAAGVLADKLIINQELEEFISVYAPKVQGAWNLHTLTLHHNLDHFVLFSSLISAFGGFAQANHSAANKYLDSFVRFRTEQGLPCCSVNWGPWSDVGAAANSRESAIGFRFLSPDQGVLSLERVMLNRLPNTVVLELGDWNVTTLTYKVGAYLDLLKTAAKGDNAQSSVDFEFRLQTVLDAAGQLEVEEKLRDLIEYVVRNILRMRETEPIDRDQDIREIGMDSLMNIELYSKLQNVLRYFPDARALNVQDLTQNLTVNKMAELVLDRLGKSAASNQAEIMEELRSQIAQDCLLPDDVKPCGGAEPPSQRFRTVLLTGATGHFGPYVLEELLSCDAELTVVCLIRGESDSCAQDRLNTTLDNLKLTRNHGMHIDTSRIRVVAGSVAEPAFGLQAEVYAKLCGQIDAIIHTAAMVDLAAPYGAFHDDDLRTHNVGGLLNILRFATIGRVKPLQFTSSVGAVTRLETDGSMPEEFPADEDYGDCSAAGYAISKFVCEKLLKQAVTRGIPCTVLRHNPIVGDSRNGHMPLERNNVVVLLRACKRIQKYPAADANAQISLVPVNIAAKVSVRLFLHHPAIESGVYNINNPKACKHSELINLLRERGHNFETVPRNNWRAALLAKTIQATETETELNTTVLASTDASLVFKTASSGACCGNMWANSAHLKKYVPEVDEWMVGTIDMIRLQLDTALAQQRTAEGRE